MIRSHHTLWGTLARFVFVGLAVLQVRGDLFGQEDNKKEHPRPKLLAAAKAFARVVADGDEAVYRRTLIDVLGLATSVKNQIVADQLEREIEERQQILNAMRSVRVPAGPTPPQPITERSFTSVLRPQTESKDFAPRPESASVIASRSGGMGPASLFDDPKWQVNMLKLIEERGADIVPKVFNPYDDESRPTTDLLDCVSICRPGSSCCTGTLLADNLVLTAAHCVPCESTHVYVGWNSNIPSTGQLSRIREVIPHPQYNQPTQYANDLAIVVLADPIPADRVRPRELATTTEIVGATTFVAAGFGKTDQGNYGIKLEAPVALRELFNKELSAGGAGFDSCQGDSGGPLYLATPSGRFHLAGVTSRGGACGYGGIYVRVDAYQDWITGTMTRVRSAPPSAPTARKAP